MQSLTSQMIDGVFPAKAKPVGELSKLCVQPSVSRLFGDDFITQKYLRQYPSSERARSWAGVNVHIQTENGVWRTGGSGYTYAGKPDAWILPFEEAVKKIDHCGPEKCGRFLRAAQTVTNFSIIQVMKMVSPPDQPRPFRLVETFVTSEGMRSRICSGAYNTLGEAEFQRETLEKIVKAGGQQ